MAASLVVNNPMPWGGTGMSPAGLALIDRGLTAMDPLPAFTLPVCCPHCGQKQDLEIHLETGRHHQIRVQMSHLGCPILGDLR